MAPSLWKALEDGTEQPITENDLFEYQRYRWLSHEPEKLAVRYRRFNLEALLKAVIKATGDQNRSCTKVLKCVEGQFNKAFILTMDDGQEVVVRIPNPNAGPEFFTIASEVATRNFVRELLDIPVPRIHAWSCGSPNLVGAEYIIEEKANGVPLGNFWFQWPKDYQLEIVRQLVHIEGKLASISFLKHGSIYYKSDLESQNVSFEPLDSVTGQSVSKNSLLGAFALGPITYPTIWYKEREKMKLDRGPWSNPGDYLTAIGRNELEWAKSYAQPRINFHRSMDHPETPDDYMSLMNRYLALAPYLIPPLANEKRLNTLAHPDLHLDNVFVDPETRQITSIIDWQAVSVSPIFLQRRYPQMLEPLDTPAQSLESNDSDKEDADMLAIYKQLLKEKDPLRWEILSDPYLPIRTKPLTIVPACWDREDLFSFRHSLISVIAHWDKLVEVCTPCPIEFTEKELEKHNAEMELIEGMTTIMQQLQDERQIPLGGRVRREDYPRARALCDKFKQDFINLAEDNRQRVLHAGVWPY